MQAEENLRQAQENQRRLNTLREAYILAIRQKVERNWLKPAGSGKMPICEVRVEQLPGGIIADVKFGACDGSTPHLPGVDRKCSLQSRAAAKPGDPELFERELNFFFNPSVQ